ncbi:peptidoglycan DD-metalloendopeptidase family protein [Luteimonas sp. 100069]|uniref:peptidoglycan DD-metalloendopeptidase family protein n=1 Tax=Luteimonas sp. 100069 TaxID=2006109 RepID=UPI000F4ED5D8|nr:peptidoglycan DD-metalloendopeptidase family protein [Luteimonas sp. 100069]RPD88390.1 LysM peptidoglycan-binding domain-containing protein [Luteimonas sp. 100069]
MRMLVVLVLVGLLSACGSSRVIREGGSTAPTSTPRPGQSVTVQRGDTVYRLATSNGISALDLATWNNIRPPYTIYPGQRLRLYPGGGSAAPARAATTGTASAQRPAVQPTQSRPQAPAAPPARSPFNWQWPTAGQVVGRYVANDPTKQGIDIAGTSGQAVNAAADGVVVYSGAGLVGYGELIIVKHDEQWLTAYGHNRSRKVNEGERVRAGQQIAELGRTGAARDMLHFEIRYNGKPVDPMSYLPAR